MSNDANIHISKNGRDWQFLEMTNNDKLINVFSKALGVKNDEISDNLKYSSSSRWDSVSHMEMIYGIEQTFNIELDTEDIINLNSFQKAKDILNKYNINCY